MTYKWTAEQIASLVPGCTVVYEGERHEVLSARRSLLDGITIVRFGLGEVWIDWIDPATIELPTTDTLTRMAVEAFGEGAYVITGCRTEPVHVCGPVSQLPNSIATFYSRPRDPEFAARECARYLAGRRR